MQIGMPWAPFANTLADAAGKVILPHFRSNLDVENKEVAAFDPVTVADRAAEEVIRKLIGETYPDHGVLGEEFGDTSDGAEMVWIIDPIDGTRAFISGLPVWGTLIGLQQAGKPVFGMMAQPFTGERFFGDGENAGYTGPGGDRVLKARSCASLSEATLFCTTPALFLNEARAAYDRVEKAARLARYGVDCYAYCMLAAGQIDIVIEDQLKVFDIMPLIPVIEGAGGIVTSWTGGPAIVDGKVADGGKVIASGDRRVHDEALGLLAAR
ncbi:Histidinol-phosphatase [Hartmannibacter diazotrophicus]|uniref:Histidinol-phosphatase n=1 Tax=Hartmannibacter diazotrophicus TaxID=1482074 RepID=A0A2C9DB96_9HYPH|nr:histidinol-phosphatase [Hartmannibacter diazotrophicus]SON57602.1 Histidinol-phosphatase [Hartmannibacter diazotrophicus]